MGRLRKVAIDVKKIESRETESYYLYKKGANNMAVQTISPAHFHEQTKRWEYASLMTELVLGWGSVILSILGIVGLFPTYLARDCRYSARRGLAVFKA